MITAAFPVAAGNAMQLVETPPDGASYWRLLRRTADVFTGADDAGAVLVADESTDNAIWDTKALVNGTTYFWRSYARIGNAWVDSGASLSAKPAATFSDILPDPQDLVRERIDLGLQAEVAAGRLKPKTGKIPVLIAPFSLAEHLTLPAVSVHMDTTGPDDRNIGDLLPDETSIGGDIITGSDGWLAHMTLAVVGVSLNADERKDLRRAIRRVVQANLDVLGHYGLVKIELHQTDDEALPENNAPLFYTRGTMHFEYPAFVSDEGAPVADITVDMTPVEYVVHG